VTGCVYLVLCDFCQFLIYICDTGALLCDLVQLNQPCLCFKSCVYLQHFIFIVSILRKPNPDRLKTVNFVIVTSVRCGAFISIAFVVVSHNFL